MANDNEDDPLGGDSFHPKRPWDPEVGYGRPPKAAQFKPGQSGNPNGRPKGAKTRRFAGGGYGLHDALLAECERTIVVREGDKTLKITQLQAILRRMMIMSMQGEPQTMRMVLRWVEQLQRADQHRNERFMEQMFKYKVDAEREVRRRQDRGITDMSDIVPHPDHIDVDFVTGDVLISGPMSPTEAAAIAAGHEDLQAMRQALAELDKLVLETQSADQRKALAELRLDVEAKVRALSEALGEPYP
jgi:hypothetical protein